MNKFKKIAMISLMAASSLLFTNAYAFRLHVVNHTLEDVKLTCKGDCASLVGAHDSVIAKASDSFFETMSNFNTEVTLTTADGKGNCLYVVQHTPDSSDGALTVDRISCEGSIEGNPHNDATHSNSFANIVLNAK